MVTREEKKNKKIIGEANIKRSLAMKKLISEGNFFSDEHRANISKSLKNRKVTWYCGHPGIPSKRKGKTMEEEYGYERAQEIKAKISKNTKKAMQNPEILKKVQLGGAKGLRNLALQKSTYIEDRMKDILDKLKLKYEEQKIIKFRTTNNGFWRRVDFYLPESNLVIECDGEHLHTKEGNDIKNKELNEQGFDVVRFSGSKIVKYPNDIANYIEIWNERLIRLNI
jgi:very-short-patch-repair endonuclease